MVLAPFGTEFQFSVWKAVLHIPKGETRSYCDIAKAIHHVHPRQTSGAVGQAASANPIVPFIPCHRVIASGGTIGGYSGGGMCLKERLLKLEGVHIDHHHLSLVS